MDRKILRVEDFPLLREDDSPKKQIQVLRDYLYKLREQLQYILNNLAEENWNDAALKAFFEKFAAASELEKLSRQVQELTEKVDALTVQAAGAAEEASV